MLADVQTKEDRELGLYRMGKAGSPFLKRLPSAVSTVRSQKEVGTNNKQIDK